MIYFITKRFNLIVLITILALFTTYIAGYGFYGWYETSAKTIYYSAQSFGLIYLSFEMYNSSINGLKDYYRCSFNIVMMLTIAVNSILFALNFQGVIKNAAWLLLILWVSVAVITASVLHNLKKYDYFND